MITRYSIQDTPFGLTLVGATSAGVCCVLFGEDERSLAVALAAEFPDSSHTRDDTTLLSTTAAVVRTMSEADADGGIVLDLQGTEFQRSVWDALREVPRGTTATYAQIAARIGFPRAVRAVAGACAANHVAVLVPCHRVVRTDGTLGGYKWGIERKCALLDWERDASPPLTR